MEAVVYTLFCVCGTFTAMVRGYHVRATITSIRILKDKWIEVALSSQLVGFLYLF